MLAGGMISILAGLLLALKCGQTEAQPNAETINADPTNTWTGTANPWTGPTEAWTGTANPWTGPTQAWTGTANPWTGPTEAWTGTANPWTGPTEAWTGTANPWTGPTVAWTGTANPWTGPTEPWTGTANPWTGPTEAGTGAPDGQETTAKATPAPVAQQTTTLSSQEADHCYSFNCEGSLVGCFLEMRESSVCHRSDKYCRVTVQENRVKNVTSITAECVDEGCEFTRMSSRTRGDTIFACCDSHLCNDEHLLQPSSSVKPAASVCGILAIWLAMSKLL